MHTDSLTGTKCIDIAADGDIYVIGNYGLDDDSRLYKVSPTGSQVKWSTGVGHWSGLTGYYTHTVHATSDSGCIISGNGWGQVTCYHINGDVVKYSKDGVLEWN
jgi:outer membrane protein assembly factor BamB